MESKIQLLNPDSNDKSLVSRESDVSLKDIDQGLEDIECMIKKLQDELLGLHTITCTLTPTHSKELSAFYSTTKLSKSTAYLESSSAKKKKVKIFDVKSKNIQVNIGELSCIKNDYNFRNVGGEEKCDVCGAVLDNANDIKTPKMQVLFNKEENTKLTNYELTREFKDSLSVLQTRYNVNTIICPITVNSKIKQVVQNQPKCTSTTRPNIEALETIDDLQKKYSEIYYDCQSTLNLCDLLKKHIDNISEVDNMNSNKNIPRKKLEIRSQIGYLRNCMAEKPDENADSNGYVLKTLDQATKAIDEVQRRCSDIWYDCLETINICKNLKQIKEYKLKLEDDSYKSEKGIQIKKIKENVTETGTQIKIDRSCKCRKAKKIQFPNKHNDIKKKSEISVKVNRLSSGKDKFNRKCNPNHSVLQQEKIKIKDKFQHNNDVDIPKILAKKVCAIAEESSDDNSVNSIDSFHSNIQQMKEKGAHLLSEDGDNDIEIQYLYEERVENVNEKLDGN